MSVEALWSVQFGSPSGGAGRGVVVFESGRLFGGDPDYTYTGTYRLKPDGTALVGKVEVTNYSGQLTSVFGQLRQFKLVIQMVLPTNNDIGVNSRAEGHLAVNPAMKIALMLTKRAHLPQ